MISAKSLVSARQFPKADILLHWSQRLQHFSLSFLSLLSQQEFLIRFLVMLLRSSLIFKEFYNLIFYSIKWKFFGVGIFVSGVSTRSSIHSPNKDMISAFKFLGYQSLFQESSISSSQDLILIAGKEFTSHRIQILSFFSFSLGLSLRFIFGSEIY